MRFCRYCIIFLLGLPFVGQAKYIESGIASIYSVRTNYGNTTASGIPLRDTDLTAAHKTLPLGTRVKVVCPRTKKSVVVKITDRGPYIRGRVIDLTPRAAQEIGLNWKRGLSKVILYKENTLPKSTPKNKTSNAIKVKPSTGAPFLEIEKPKIMSKNKSTFKKYIFIGAILALIMSFFFRKKN
jgi:rare lipoprotein A